MTPPQRGFRSGAQVAPLLHRRCAACHNEDSAKGRYRLDSLVRLWKAGESDLPPIVAGKPRESELYLRLVETAADDRMPQKADALPAAAELMVAKKVSGLPVLDAEDRLVGILTSADFMSAMNLDSGVVAGYLNMSVDQLAAQLAEMPIDEFLSLNPQTYAGPVIDGKVVVEQPGPGLAIVRTVGIGTGHRRRSSGRSRDIWITSRISQLK